MSKHWLARSLITVSFLLQSCGLNDTAGPDEAGPTVSLAVTGSGSWTAKAPIPTPRIFLTAGVATGPTGQQLLYAIGGFDPGSGLTRAVEAYNIASDSWISRAPLPVALISTNGVGNIGGKLYLSGGVVDTPTDHGPQRSLYVYDPIANRWTRRKDMPKRTSAGITGVIGGKLYVLVGHCGDCAVSSPRRLFRYDPATNTWTGTLPSSPNHHGSGAGGVINGKFYVAGGREHGRDSNKLDVYDPATNRWRTLAPMPTARSGIAAAVLGGKLYVLGSANVYPGEPQGMVEAYDPVTNTWSTKARMLHGRGDLAAGRVTFNGRGYILAVGGTDVEGSGAGDANEAYRE